MLQLESIFAIYMSTNRTCKLCKQTLVRHSNVSVLQVMRVFVVKFIQTIADGQQCFSAQTAQYR